MEIVDLTDQQWREFFLLEDAAKRKDYMMNLVGKHKIDVKELTAGETGGLALKTTSRIELAIGDRLKFFTRETKKRTL